ncbi:hypothetical protein LJJ44_08945 [Pseudomonas sp. B24_DOA]|nr:hypothetical protein LJJ44_08945 [Pseudomonas sp. B24_DOA]WKV87419.1 hypothetical protein LJU32_16980 [Pseudomonas sp. B21_DOA]
MSRWKYLSVWGKVWACFCVAFLILTASETGIRWMGGGSSARKRVFSPGFIVPAVFAAVVELMLLNHFYDGRMS